MRPQSSLSQFLSWWQDETLWEHVTEQNHSLHGQKVKENEEGLGPTVPQSDGTFPVTPVSDIRLLLRVPQLLIPRTVISVSFGNKLP